MIACAAVIGQENAPLWLRSFLRPSNQDDDLRFNYIVHCALDAVDEKLNAPNRTPGDVSDAFLGMLYPTEDYKVYGFVSNTRVKFILAIENEPVMKDDEIRLVFKRFHAAYVDALSNPFYDVDALITSVKFALAVKRAVDFANFQ